MKKIKTLLSIIVVVCLLSLTFFPASAASFILGDADGDGYATIADVTLIQRALFCISYDDSGRLMIEKNSIYNAYINYFHEMGVTGSALNRALEDFMDRSDVDRDGMVTIVDATFIQRYSLDFSVPYPIGKTIQNATEPSTEAPTQAPTQASTQAPTQASTQTPTAKPDPYELPPV